MQQLLFIAYYKKFSVNNKRNKHRQKQEEFLSSQNIKQP